MESSYHRALLPKPLPRLYAIIDTGAVRRRGCTPETAAEAFLAAGAEMLQLRHKQFDRDTYDAARRIAALCREAGANFIVNDRADIALLLDAGLHIGQDDLPAADARRLIGRGAALGFSTHNEAQLRASADLPIDYVGFGPIFPTASKQDPDPVTGVERLRRLRPVCARPLVAIGGIARANARQVLEAGADAVAVIGDLYPEPCTKQTLRDRAEEWLSLVR
ncbi:MAG: thiamine phosphate synthase [Acidobacteria bacterium]|nr:thiamine phosphate synthase [Acidobacteriota bacterium]